MPLAKLPAYRERGTFCVPIVNGILDYVRKGVPITVACQAMGVHYTTVSRWRQRGDQALIVENQTGVLPEAEYPFAKFTLDLAQSRAEAIANRIGQIDRAGEGGAWQASAWWLERQMPSEFTKVDKHEVTGGEGGPIQVSQAEVVSEAQQIVARQMKELSERSDDG